MRSPERTRVDRVLVELGDALRPYDVLQTDMEVLVSAWQELDHGARRRLGMVAPTVVDALLRIEAHQKRLAPVDAMGA